MCGGPGQGSHAASGIVVLMFRSPGIRVLCGVTVAVLAAFVIVRTVTSTQVSTVSAEAANASSGVKKEAGQLVEETTSSLPSPSSAPASPAPQPETSTALPPDSGSGKRMVFSISQQRVWWVDASGAELRTALVSGRANTPQTGTFQVYSKTENATGLDGSKMNFFVRFTKGPQGWAIGFHNIPRVNGEPAQTEEQLGQPLSHGCIRQAEVDAVFTWNFLDVGSTVVVLA